jgi:hypothetical protein
MFGLMPNFRWEFFKERRDTIRFPTRLFSRFLKATEIFNNHLVRVRGMVQQFGGRIRNCRTFGFRGSMFGSIWMGESILTANHAW